MDLLKYNVEEDKLEPTEDLKNGNSEIIKDIASNVKGWAGNWDAVYDNVLLRGEIKNEIVKAAERTGKDKILEAEFVRKCNEAFHRISEEVRREKELPWKEYVFPRWKDWLEKELKKV